MKPNATALGVRHAHLVLAPILLGRDLVVVLPFYRFVAVLLAAGLLAHRLRLAARTTPQHGGRWRWRWHVIVAAHVA
jgi:hypothetical protein